MEKLTLVGETLTYDKLTIGIVEIGPALAEQLLATYKTDYRKLRPKYSEGLARDMVNGYWNFDGSPIKFDEEDSLFDGQHRLHAVILSDTTQRFLFISGLPKSAYHTTDTGLPRKYSDTLRMRGYNNVNNRQALVKFIAKWEAGKSYDDSKKLTSAEYDVVHDQHVDTISRALECALSARYKVPVSPSVFSFAWWLLTRIDREQAYTFLVSVAEGENLRHGMPAYTLRQRLIRESGNRLTRNEILHLIFAAWNAFRDGNEIVKLQMPKGPIVTRENMDTPK